MNLIQKQATDFYINSQYSEGFSYYKPFVDEVKLAINEYRKTTHKIEFLDTIINQLKKSYDEHMTGCTHPDSCITNKFYENSLFFLQEEVEDLEQNIPSTEFNRVQRYEAAEAIEAFVAELNSLKVGQQITYDDLMQEFKDLREFLYLEKKTLSQLMLGKLTEVVSGGVAGDLVSETVSKSLLDMIKEHYSTLLSFKF